MNIFIFQFYSKTQQADNMHQDDTTAISSQIVRKADDSICKNLSLALNSLPNSTAGLDGVPFFLISAAPQTFTNPL